MTRIMHDSGVSFKEMATTYAFQIGQMEHDGTIKEEGASTLICGMIIDLAHKYTEDTGIDGLIDHSVLAVWLQACVGIRDRRISNRSNKGAFSG